MQLVIVTLAIVLASEAAARSRRKNEVGNALENGLITLFLEKEIQEDFRNKGTAQFGSK